MIFIACQKETNTAENNTSVAKTILNVSYGSDTAQRMDVYLPANRNTTDTKVLVMIHGGAWTTGDKTDFNEYLPVFKQRLPGYALFNINYRLASLPSVNIFPTQEEDVKAAIASILSKETEYSFNKNKLVLLGASAGAHLALLQSYKNSSPKINAVVDMFGPTDMVSLYNSFTDPLERAISQALLNGTPTTNPTGYQASSPINFVTAQSPPTLILHGGQDPLVPLAQSTALKAKLETAGVPVQMVVYPSEGHSLTGQNLLDAYDRITAFLTQYNP